MLALFCIGFPIAIALALGILSLAVRIPATMIGLSLSMLSTGISLLVGLIADIKLNDKEGATKKDAILKSGVYKNIRIVVFVVGLICAIIDTSTSYRVPAGLHVFIPTWLLAIVVMVIITTIRLVTKQAPQISQHCTTGTSYRR